MQYGAQMYAHVVLLCKSKRLQKDDGPTPKTQHNSITTIHEYAEVTSRSTHHVQNRALTLSLKGTALQRSRSALISAGGDESHTSLTPSSSYCAAAPGVVTLLWPAAAGLWDDDTTALLLGASLWGVSKDGPSELATVSVACLSQASRSAGVPRTSQNIPRGACETSRKQSMRRHQKTLI